MSGIFQQKKKQTSQSLQNVKVVVRVRPLSKQEKEQNVKSIVTPHTNRELILKEKKYNFDRVFKPTATQIELYMNVVAPLIQDVVEGYNCTVFAYGQTGTGKTYTMTGEKCNLIGNWQDDVDAGIIPRAAFHIFSELGKMSNVDMNVKVSYIELYNEEIRDLLSDDEGALQMYSDNKGTVSINGLTETLVHDAEGICKLLQRGIVKRQIAPTLMNHQSSRSHTVFTISINTRESTISGDDILKAGKINLVDLAGNENIARSGCKDLRATELANINRSLLTLGRVIHALVDKSQKHVPYRDSKLTRILQDSLGGHTKTVIIATVSPAHTSYEETTSTLDYASRARDIKNTPTVNEKLTKHDLMESLKKEIDRLQKDLDAARSGSGFYVDKENYQKMLDAIIAVTGEHITAEELTERKAERIRNLEDRMYARVKEFENTIEQCKKHQQELELAQATIKEQDDFLEQEKFLSKWYENQTVETFEEAQKFLAVTKTLSNEKELLLAKLEHQFNINISNQHITVKAVSNAINMLDKFGDDECRKIKLSEKRVRDEFEKNVLDLQRDFHKSSNKIQKLSKECESKVKEEKNGFSLKKCIASKTKQYFDIMKHKTDVFEDVLSQYQQQLNLLKSEVPRIAESCRQNSEKYLNQITSLYKTSEETSSEIMNQQNKKNIEVLDNLEKTLLNRKDENEAMIGILQKQIDEANVTLSRIKVDRENIANSEKMIKECIKERAINLEKLAKESFELMQKCCELPAMIEIQDAQVQELLVAGKEFEKQLGEISSIMDKKYDDITQLTIDHVSQIILSIDETLDEKVKNLLDIIDTIMGKTEIVESFTVFVNNIKKILNEQILEKNVTAKHVGDTPVRQSTVLPTRIKDVAPREALIEKFKETILSQMEDSDVD